MYLSAVLSVFTLIFALKSLSPSALSITSIEAFDQGVYIDQTPDFSIDSTLTTCVDDQEKETLHNTILKISIRNKSAYSYKAKKVRFTVREPGKPVHFKSIWFVPSSSNLIAPGATGDVIILLTDSISGNKTFIGSSTRLVTTDGKGLGMNHIKVELQGVLKGQKTKLIRKESIGLVFTEIDRCA